MIAHETGNVEARRPRALPPLGALRCFDAAARSGRTAIVVSCEPTLLMRWLIPALPEMQAAHPEIEVQIAAADGPVPFERESIDVARRRNDVTAPFGFARDHSNYCMVTPAGTAHHPRIETLLRWLTKKARQQLAFLPETTRASGNRRTVGGAVQEALRG